MRFSLGKKLSETYRTDRYDCYCGFVGRCPKPVAAESGARFEGGTRAGASIALLSV